MSIIDFFLSEDLIGKFLAAVGQYFANLKWETLCNRF